MSEFRIDDVCLNTNAAKLFDICEILSHYGSILLAINPICYDRAKYPDWNRMIELPFPPIGECWSDRLGLATGDIVGVHPVVYTIKSRFEDVTIASHGLFHVDHRLLTLEAQELSIVQSCAIVQSKTFVPPFNKYDKNTEDACSRRGIKLIRWGDYQHAKYNKYDSGISYYLHSFDVSYADQVQRWIDGGALC